MLRQSNKLIIDFEKMYVKQREKMDFGNVMRKLFLFFCLRRRVRGIGKGLLLSKINFLILRVAHIIGRQYDNLFVCVCMWSRGKLCVIRNRESELTCVDETLCFLIRIALAVHMQITGGFGKINFLVFENLLSFKKNVFQII